MTDDVAPAHAAPQHATGPRPLPLFLELVRRVAERDPALAARALTGLAAYQKAPRLAAPRHRQELARVGPATLRDCGGTGRPIILVPSLINPPTILDLDDQTSLAEPLTASGHVLLLDWGAAADRHDLDLGSHVTDLLVPLLTSLGEAPVLMGYCLGGTLALAAGSLATVQAVVTLAAPWHFDAYPETSRGALASIWQQARAGAQALGVLPIEVLQAAFWSLDPARVVAKFARLAELQPIDAEAQRFILLEDWANGGEPLPLPAARELVEDLFGADLSGRGEWIVGGQRVRPPAVPTLHFKARQDLIVPERSAPTGEQRSCSSGHVGMIVGHRAGSDLHLPLTEWLARIGSRR